LGALPERLAGEWQVKQSLASPPRQVKQPVWQGLHTDTFKYSLLLHVKAIQELGAVPYNSSNPLQLSHPMLDPLEHVEQLESQALQILPSFHLFEGHVVRQELGAVLWRAFRPEQVRQAVVVPLEHVEQLESQALQYPPSLYMAAGQPVAQVLGADP
jgi:hypothetical protein